MVVVIVIGLIAVLAIPTMSASHFDRLAYDDAGAIMQLLRSARTHAIARGGAVLVHMSAADGTDRGTFQMFEAVTNNSAGAGGARTPVASCKTPTDWTPVASGQPNANVLRIDGVNLNDTLETNADISAKLWRYVAPSNAGTSQSTLNVCWTPLGRSYIATGDQKALMFDGQTPAVTPLEIAVQRAGGGTIRSVVLPPNGMARVFSHVVGP
jgi:type II secretory pathway pseudopilin PulG